MLARFIVFVGTIFSTHLWVISQDQSKPDPIAEKKPKYLQMELSLDERVADLIQRMSLEEKAIALNHNGPDLKKFGLRSDKWNQCLNGVQWNRPTTLFPSCIAMAATWDPVLIETDVARVLSDEARAIYNVWRKNPNTRAQHKGLIYRDPVINIGRNPYWGRNHEAWGEDPYLTGRMGVAYVKGLQGSDPHYLKIAATLKHYAVNNVESGRFSLDAKVNRGMLHDYWLPHFRDAVVEAKACSLMASYNAINGTPNNINHWLLTEILKRQWKHEGFVVSDLGGVQTMVQGHEANRMTYVDAVAKSLMAGCDFSGKEYQRFIPQAVREGKLTTERLNDALARVLKVRFRLGEFDPPESVPYHNLSPEIIASKAHRAVALKTARKSIVLLQNHDSLLPIDKTNLKRLAVIGPLADRVVLNNYNGRHVNLVTPLQGIKKYLGDQVEIVHSKGVEMIRRGDRVATRIDRETGFSGGESVKLESTHAGEYIEFPINTELSGEYSVVVQYKSFPSRGRFQMSIDGIDIGEALDMYSANPRYGLKVEIGKEKLAKGVHRIRFTTVGKNENSQGLTGHFDQLQLQGDKNLTIELEQTKFKTGRPRQSTDPIASAAKLAADSDLVFLFVGTDQTVEQEGRDRKSLGLPGDQLKLIQKVYAANPNAVVVLQSAGPLTVPWVKQNIPAVLQAWWGGEEGGTAIAEVLFGTTNPAGRLPHTVYASENQVPPLDQYDISKGFTYMYLRGDPLYSFGHGLSYTTFDYDKLRIASKTNGPSNSLEIQFNVKNNGARAGDEVAQLYVCRPNSDGPTPRIQLMGFQRFHLDAGRTDTISLSLPVEKLARYNEKTDRFEITPGTVQTVDRPFFNRYSGARRSRN